MSEAGSSAEPPRKRARRDERRRVRLQFKAPNQKTAEVWVYDFWLSSSEFFEAKFARWSSCDGKDIDPIVLELPTECKTDKGAAIFKKRLLAADLEEEVDWDSIKWWRSVGGDEESLFAALYIFDLVLMQHYCKEVAETLFVFRIYCPIGFWPLASKFNEGVRVDTAPCETEASNPIQSMAISKFAGLAGACARGEEAVKPFLYRALAGCSAEDWRKKCIALVLARLLSQDPSVSSWMDCCLARFVTSNDVPACVKDLLLTLQTISHTDSIDEHVKDRFSSLVSEVLHRCLKESSRQQLAPTRHREVVAAVVSVMKYASLDFDDVTGIEDLLRDVSTRFKSSIVWPIFAVASSSAQRACLLALGQDVGKLLRNNAHLVHPDVRDLLVDHILDLSPRDQEYLATAPFPQQPGAPESEDSQHPE